MSPNFLRYGLIDSSLTPVALGDLSHRIPISFLQNPNDLIVRKPRSLHHCPSHEETIVTN